MGQQDVLNFLSGNKGQWFTSKDIAESIEQSRSSVQNNLSKLRRTSLLSYIPHSKGKQGYKYMIK